jgi:hypothetical protein
MAEITRHNPAAVHAPSSGYSMGLELGQHRRLLFVSGHVPERSDGTVPEGFEAQCEQAGRNGNDCRNRRRQMVAGDRGDRSRMKHGSMVELATVRRPNSSFTRLAMTGRER